MRSSRVLVPGYDSCTCLVSLWLPLSGATFQTRWAIGETDTGRCALHCPCPGPHLGRGQRPPLLLLGGEEGMCHLQAWVPLGDVGSLCRKTWPGKSSGQGGRESWPGQHTELLQWQSCSGGQPGPAQPLASMVYRLSMRPGSASQPEMVPPS